MGDLSSSTVVVLIAILVIIAVAIGCFFLIRFWTKRKMQLASDKTTLVTQQKSTSSSAITEAQTNQAAVSDQQGGFSKIVFGSVAQPQIEIYRHKLFGNEQLEEIIVTPRIKIGLQALLQQAPTLAVNAALATSSVYLVKFSPEVTAGLANGTFSLMNTLSDGIKSVAVDPAGKIVQQGNIIPSFQPMTVALAIWQFLAFVTAQKFLTDINNRLAKIEQNVQEIKAILEGLRLSKIIGDLSYLRSLPEAIHCKDLTDHDINNFSNELEQIEVGYREVMPKLQSDLDEITHKFTKQKLTGINVKKHAAETQNLLDEYAGYLHAFWLAIYCSGSAAQLRCALPLSRRIALIRINELSDIVKVRQTKVSMFLEIVERRLPDLRGRFSKGITNTRLQDRISAFLEKDLKELQNMGSMLSKMLSETKQLLDSQVEEESKPQEFVVDLGEGGEVVQLRRLLPKKNALTA